MNARAKILIVDDEPFNVDYLEQELEELNYDTVSAGNGQEALNKVAAESPDLVLLDIMMPIMDGFEVLARLKASSATRDIPVIIISANNDLQSVVRGIKQGAEDYLPKPFEPVLLHARIETGLTKKRHRDQELEYLRQVEALTGAAVAIEQSTYEAGMIESVAARTDALGELARVFRRMAQEVREREQRLKRQLQQLQLDIEEKQLARAETVAHYIPMDRRQALARGVRLPEHAHGAALFADVSGFTALTASLAAELGLHRGAEEITRNLNRVYSVLIDEVHKFGGSVIAFSGDAITCWFDDQDETGVARASAAHARAAACALAMQAGMRQFATLTTPAGTKISLAIKVAVAAGPASRLLVGKPGQHQIDVLAGGTLATLAEAEGAARKGEVVVAAAGFPSIEQDLVVSEWREGGAFAHVSGLMRDVPASPWPALGADAIREEQARPWMMPAVFDRVRTGNSDLLSELRPVTALFMQFSGLAYDTDPLAGAKLDAFVQWIATVTQPYDGAIIQLIVGDKGSYCYFVFGAPVAHHDDAARAVAAALALSVPPSSLGYITDLKIGLAQGQMRVGAYGGSSHRTYGAIGDKTNLAARLMQAARTDPGGDDGVARAAILCDDVVFEATQMLFSYDALPPIKVKGKSEPIAVYRPIERLPEGTGASVSLLGRTVERALRIDRLSPAQQLTLKVASVIGSSFTFAVLAAIYPDQTERDHLGAHLTALAEHDLVVQRSTESASYSFTDPLTHDTAYSLMLFAQRRQLHRAVAELLEQQGAVAPPYAQIAHHWQAANDIPKAVHALELAGGQARAAGDYEEASRLLQASLMLNE